MIAYHSYSVFDIIFTEKHLISCSKDRKIGIFSTDTFELVHGAEIHSRAINCITLDESEQYLLSGSNDKTVKVFSLKEQKVVHEYKCSHPVTSIQINTDNIVVVGDVTGQLIVLRLTKEELQFQESIREEQCHSERVNAIRWNGQQFATCSNDHSVRIYGYLP